MTAPPSARAAAVGLALAVVATPTASFAQAAPLSEGIAVGGWTFRPSLEVRTRGEYRRSPVDTGGDIYETTAVLGDGYGSNAPTVGDTNTAVKNQWLVGERTRLGVAVDRGAVTAAFVLQDARVWGTTEASFAGAGQPALPSLAPFEAYIDVHTRSGRRAFFRLGRQRVVWGEGRLIGASDWSPTGRSFDAARFGIQLGDVDVEALGALLAAPGALPPEVTGTREPVGEGTGAQLYGADAVWHFLPLLKLEGTVLGRIVREPRPIWITPGDTLVGDARIFGDRRGFQYSLEGAYELGRVATYSNDAERASRSLHAFALFGRASLETSLPLHLTFGAEGAYASGEQNDGKDVFANQTRFDPIFPDQREGVGKMGLWAWSNLIEAGGDITAKPSDDVSILLGYRYVALAAPEDRWSTAALMPVGAAPGNTARTLGHELDAILGVTPWDPLRIEVGYGLFLLGQGGKAILEAAHRDSPGAAHYGYLQATVRAP